MPGSSWQNGPAMLARQLQIIVGAMMVGCLFFMVIVVATGWGGEPSPQPLVTYLAAAVAGAMLLARCVVPGLLVTQGRKRIARSLGKNQDQSGTGPFFGQPASSSVSPPSENMDLSPSNATQVDATATKLGQLFMAKTLVGAAMLEGVTLLLLVAFILERSPPSLIFAVVLIGGLALHFPTPSSTEAWIEDQLRLLREERQWIDHAVGG